MYRVLGGILLFAAVCGVGLFIAFSVQRRMERRGQPTFSYSDPYIQFMQDKQSLNVLGYAQQLRRCWNGFGAFSVSFTTMSLLAGAAVYFGSVFTYGGAWSFSIGWPIVSLFAILVAAAVSEMASAIPTSGGGYHWAYAAGGRAWAWLAAWLRGLGDFGLLILVNWAAAYLIDSALSIKLGYGSGTFSLLSVALPLFASQMFVAGKGRFLLGMFTKLGAWLQVGLIVVIVGGMAIVTGPNLQPADYLFSFVPGGTEEGGIVQMMLALLLLHRLFAGVDAAAYAVEETSNPKINAPWSIYLTSVYGFVFGYVLLSFIALSLTGVTGFHDNSNAFLAITTGIWGTWNPIMNNVILFGILFALWGSGLGCLNSASRLWFAYHRDARTAVNRWLARVETERLLPNRLILLIGIATFIAFAVLLWVNPWKGNYKDQLLFLTTWCILCFNLAFAVPLGLLLMRKRVSRFRERAWHLGRLSLPIRFAALIWLLAASAAAVWLLDGSAAVLLFWTLSAAAVTGAINRKLGGGVSKFSKIPTREELLSIERQYNQM